MLRVRPGVELVRASLVPTRELMTLDLPTFERPRKATSGIEGAGKWATSVAAARNRARTLISQCAMFGKKLASWGGVDGGLKPSRYAVLGGFAAAMPRYEPPRPG